MAWLSKRQLMGGVMVMLAAAVCWQTSVSASITEAYEDAIKKDAQIIDQADDASVLAAPRARMQENLKAMRQAVEEHRKVELNNIKMLEEYDTAKLLDVPENGLTDLFLKWKADREKISAFYAESLSYYSTFSKLQLRNDLNHINNVGKGIIKNAPPATKAPGLGSGNDLKGMKDDAKQINKFVQQYNKTKADFDAADDGRKAGEEQLKRANEKELIFFGVAAEFESIRQSIRGINRELTAAIDEKIKQKKSNEKITQSQQAAQERLRQDVQVVSPPLLEDEKPDYSWVNGLLSRYHALQEEMSRDFYPQEPRSPLILGSVSESLREETTYQWDLDQITWHAKEYGEILKWNTRIQEVLRAYKPEFEALLEEFKKQVAFSRGASQDPSVMNSLRQIAGTVNLFDPVIEVANLSEEVLNGNRALCEKVREERRSDAREYAALYQTQVNNFNLAVQALRQAFAGLKKESDKEGKVSLGVLQKQVRDLYASGEGRQVEALIKKKSEIYSSLLDGIHKVLSLKGHVHDVYRNAGFGIMPDAPLAYGDMRSGMAGVVDQQASIIEAWQDYARGFEHGDQEVAEVLGQRQALEMSLAAIARFYPVIGIIDAANQAIRANPLGGEFGEQMDILSQVQGGLAGWVDVSGSSEDPAFLVLYADTRKAIRKAEEEAARQLQAEAALKQEKLEEERKQREHKSMLASGVRLSDPRVNGKDLQGIMGKLVLLPGDLKNGKIELTGNIEGLDALGVDKMFISFDSGITSKEIRPASRFSYSFTPEPEKWYRPGISVLLKDGTTVGIAFHPMLQTIVFRNLDHSKAALASLQAISEAYERQDTNAFVRLISRDYLGNKASLEDGVQFDFAMFSNIRLVLNVSSIKQTKDYFVVETRWEKTQIPRTTGEQQRTTGQTVFVFVAEDGELKIRNLRGDLIFATLSADIAQSSGLPRKIIDAIRMAHDARDPVQPGSAGAQGSSVSSGASAAGSASAVSVQTVTLTGVSGADLKYIDFETGMVGDGSQTGDIYFEGAVFFPPMGATTDINQRDPGSNSFSGLDTVPGDFSNNGSGAANGDEVYILLTDQGHYVKMHVQSVTDLGGGSYTIKIRYAIQLDGSKNIKTQ